MLVSGAIVTSGISVTRPPSLGESVIFGVGMISLMSGIMEEGVGFAVAVGFGDLVAIGEAVSARQPHPVAITATIKISAKTFNFIARLFLSFFLNAENESDSSFSI